MTAQPTLKTPSPLPSETLDTLEALHNKGAFVDNLRVEMLSESFKYAVYILVFVCPRTGQRRSVSHARTYIGISKCINNRYSQHHKEDRGANLTRAARAMGYELKIAAIFLTDDKDLEFALKDFHSGDRAIKASVKRITSALKRNKLRKSTVIPAKIKRRTRRLQRASQQYLFPTDQQRLRA